MTEPTREQHVAFDWLALRHGAVRVSYVGPIALAFGTDGDGRETAYAVTATTGNVRRLSDNAFIFRASEETT